MTFVLRGGATSLLYLCHIRTQTEAGRLQAKGTLTGTHHLACWTYYEKEMSTVEAT